MDHKFATAYGPRQRVTISFAKTGRTKQSFREESNINIILAKYIKTGLLEHAQNYAGQYAFATSNDFQQSMQIIIKAQSMFDELPSETRKKFANQPEEFLEFVQDPKNEQELIDMGLSHPKEAASAAAEALPAASEEAAKPEAKPTQGAKKDAPKTSST